RATSVRIGTGLAFRLNMRPRPPPPPGRWSCPVVGEGANDVPRGGPAGAAAGGGVFSGGRGDSGGGPGPVPAAPPAGGGGTDGGGGGGAARTRRLPPPGRFICALLPFGRGVPRVPVQGRMNLARVAAARRAALRRPSWCAVFTKAFALVAAARPELRR